MNRLIAVFLMLAATAFAGPQLTTIQDVVYKADGTLMNASAVITWSSFEAGDTSAIGLQSLTVPVVNGSIYVLLVPNTNASPSVPYTVTYSSNGMFQFQETWMVPPSLTPLRVRDVRTGSTTIPANGGTAPTAQNPITETSVTGLTADLASRPLKGPSFGTGRVAMIDANGTLNTVFGNFSDCVFVDGSTGPCLDATVLPNYSDNETPGGIVDGVNNSFTLAGTPSPAGSLLLFRNGMAMKSGFDYTLNNTALLFSAGAAPQPGDTLIASYRMASLSSLQGGQLNGPPPVPFSTQSPQVICSSSGSTTSSTTLTSLGTCTIPASFLAAGDRVEVRFTLTHGGTANGFTYLVKWGSAIVVQRNAGANDAVVGGRADAGIIQSGAEVTGESFGTVLALLPVTGLSTDLLTAPITLSFSGNLALASSDVVSLQNFTVIRYPAISHP